MSLRKLSKYILIFVIYFLTFPFLSQDSYAYNTGILNGLKYAQGAAFDYLAANTAYTGTNITDNQVTTFYSGTNPSLWFKLPTETNGIKTYAMKISQNAQDPSYINYKYDLYFYDSQGNEVYHQASIINDGQYRSLGQFVDKVKFVEIRNTNNSNKIAEFVLQSDPIGLIGPDKIYQIEDGNHKVIATTTLGYALGNYLTYSFSTPQIITKWSVDTSALSIETWLEFYDSSGKLLKNISGFSEHNGEVNTLSEPLNDVAKISYANKGQYARNVFRLDLWGLPPNTTPPVAPTGLNAFGGNSQVSLSWQANPETDLQGYFIYQNGSKLNTTPISSTSYIAKGLTNGQTYNFAVSAINTSGYEGQKSSTVTGKPINSTPPLKVSGLTASAGNASVSLSWTANPETDIAGYNIYVNGSKIANTATNSFLVASGLTNGQTYTFSVSAINTSGTEGLKADITAKPVNLIPPNKVSGLTASAGNNSVSLSWVANSETDIAGYNIYMDGVKIANTAKTSFIVASGVTNGEEYSFVLSAVNTSGIESVMSEIVTAIPSNSTPPASPSGLSVTVGNGTIFVTWNPNSESDLAGYFVYLDGVKQNSTRINETNYTLNGLTNGQTYSVSVTAVNTSNAQSPRSGPLTAKPLNITPPVKPNGLTVDRVGDGSVFLSWTANPETDIAGYFIYRGSLKVNTSPVNATGYIVASGLTNGQEYTFTLTAVNTSGVESPQASSVKATPIDNEPPAKPTGLKGISNETQIKLTWNANTEMDLAGYFVYMNGSKVSPKINTNTYTVSGLTLGQTHSFQVSAIDTSSNESEPSDSITVTTQQRTPTPTTIKKPNSLDVVWKPMNGAVSYDVYYNDKLVTNVPGDVSDYSIDKSMGYDPNSPFQLVKIVAHYPDGSTSGDIGSSAKTFGFDSSDIWSNSAKIFFFLALFILFGITIAFAPRLIDMAKNSLK